VPKTGVQNDQASIIEALQQAGPSESKITLIKNKLQRAIAIGYAGWPPGSRLLVRREVPHPGAQPAFTDVRGTRLSALPHQPRGPRYRLSEGTLPGTGRCEQVIRDLKDTGLGPSPAAASAVNEAWLTAS
jgi:hypothetical protein